MIQAFAAFEPGGELKPFEYDPGPLRPHEVEIDVQYCGICHSDLSVLDNEWGMTQYPVVPGHEVVGTIAKAGDNVKHLTVGQIVGLGWHSGYCNACTPCHTGDHNLCANAQATIIGHHGGFADKVRAAANSVVPIPDGIDLESAGPLFCGGITVFNPLVQFDTKPTDKVAVIGIGGLGHMALQFLNAWGCEVTAFTSSEDKRKEALSLGAHHTLNSRDQKGIEAAAGRFDLIISTVNVKLDWNLYLGTLKPRGRLHFVGATLDPLDINVFSLIMGQHAVSGSPVGSPLTIARMLEFAKRHNVRPVIEKFSFDDINEAIKRLRSGQAHYRIVLQR
ncbi:alcohol dehydrogenase [Sulfuriferula plumbiphila]|uniref:alcohol dehydrogenase (NADP(+)) n=1 Tax=Sulfuriferula plumbiphila TaxID=171865 RepID=A0A512L880_9PROT|nr:NAD(P)-dependent alcohol dehydrogenase [Sulfuriferula plumbiphila]BBP05604.1 alcohol dehydrogenase [Sulfuriferula plumbiphila]GEP30689.1 alcohol dehydrogenase [Sulfuriferula plumbiphila]